METAYITHHFNNVKYDVHTPNSGGTNSGALLDMLAEVASHTLHNDPSVKSSFYKKNGCKMRIAKQKSSSNRGTDISEFSLEQLSNFTANNLLKLFADFDGDEMKKTFTFTCALEPNICRKEISSFGSETKARNLMKNHLLEHVDGLLSRNKYKVPSYSEPAKLQKRQSMEESTELSCKRRRRSNCVTDGEISLYSETTDENDSSFSNKKEPSQEENIREYAIAEFDKNTEIFCKEVVIQDVSSVYSVQFEHNYAYMHEQHGGSNENSYRDSSNNEELDQDCNSSNSDTLSCTSDVGSAGDDRNNLEISVDTFFMHDIENYCESVPWVEQEIDIDTTEQMTDLQQEDSESLEVVKPVQNNFVPIKKAEFSIVKKPKGKAKFIGQSKAEKEMAIRLIDNMKMKGSNDNLECHICQPSRTFTAATTLISHYRSHAGIKPFECRICGSAFTRQHSLNYHMLIHSNQTRFTCADCGRKFRHPSHFKEHRRRHTGEAPYECEDCSVRFKTRNTYKRHLKTRHGKVLTTVGNVILSPAEADAKEKVISHSEVNLDEEEFNEPKPKKAKRSTGSKNLSENICLKPSNVVTHQDVREDFVVEKDWETQVALNDEDDGQGSIEYVLKPTVDFSDPEEPIHHCSDIEEPDSHFSDAEESVRRFSDAEQYSDAEDSAHSYPTHHYSDIVEEAVMKSNILFSDSVCSGDKVKVESVWYPPEHITNTEFPYSCNSISMDLENLNLKDSAEDNVSTSSPVLHVVSSTLKALLQQANTVTPTTDLLPNNLTCFAHAEPI